MAKLCQECQGKKPDTSVRGTCMAPNYVQQSNLPQGHVPWTESPNFNLCDTCAEHFGRCAWCGGPLDGYGYSMLPTTKQFCKQFDSDNGNHVEGMYVGEQICAQFIIDVYSGIGWRVKSTSRNCRLAGQRQISDGGQYAWVEMYFDLNEAGQAHIELEQASTRSWVSLPNPKTWKITVEVKH